MVMSAAVAVDKVIDLALLFVLDLLLASLLAGEVLFEFALLFGDVVGVVVVVKSGDSWRRWRRRRRRDV